MRDPKRIDRICELLKECWLCYPDQRFFQLIVNLYNCDKGDAFYIEDDEAEKMMTEFIEKAIYGR